MSSHPSPDELFDAAVRDAPDPHATHLAACDSCRAAFERLRVGVALLDDARANEHARNALDALDWPRVDAAIESAAEQVAADLRKGTLRAPRAWLAYAIGAVGATTLAAAAAGVAYVRVRPVGMPPAPVATPTRAPTPAMPAVPPHDTVATFEGAVLLAAGGATQTPADASSPRRVADSASVREGARVETGAAGRAVFTVQPAVALDVRPDSEVTLRTMRVDTTSVALARGELAVEHGANGGIVTLHAGRWDVSLDGNAAVRATSELVRVVVLSGRATTTAEGVSTAFSGPVVIELPAAVGDARTVANAPRDAARLRLARFSAQAALWQMPTIDATAALSLRGHGPLPAAVEALRLGEPATLEARVGRQVYTLEIGSGRVLEWRRSAATAASSGVVRPSSSTPSEPILPALGAVSPSAGRELTQQEIQAMSRSVGARIRHCFTRCIETNQCGTPQGAVVFDVRADGATSLGAIDPSVANARACLAREAQFIRFPSTGGAFPFRVTIR